MLNINHFTIRKLSHSTAGLFFGIFVFVALIFQAVIVQAADITSASILQLVNSERTKAGLKPLQENTALSTAAEAKLDHMFKNDYFSHTSPKGEAPWFWVKQSGYSYQYAGENLAINYSSAEKQHNAWMKSETHRANILSNKFTETGIAVKSGKLNGRSATITVEMFGAPYFAQVEKIVQLPSPQDYAVQMAPGVLPVPVSNQQVLSETVNGSMNNPKLMPVLSSGLKQKRGYSPLWQGWFQMIKIENWSFDVLQKATLITVILLVAMILAPQFILIGEASKCLFGLWSDRRISDSLLK